MVAYRIEEVLAELAASESMYRSTQVSALRNACRAFLEELEPSECPTGAGAIVRDLAQRDVITIAYYEDALESLGDRGESVLKERLAAEVSNASVVQRSYDVGTGGAASVGVIFLKVAGGVYAAIKTVNELAQLVRNIRDVVGWLREEKSDPTLGNDALMLLCFDNLRREFGDGFRSDPNLVRFITYTYDEPMTGGPVLGGLRTVQVPDLAQDRTFIFIMTPTGDIVDRLVSAHQCAPQAEIPHRE